jgi:hypothetical protein
MGLRSPQPQEEAAVPQEGQPPEVGGAEELLVQASEALNKLGALIEKSPLPEEDKQAFAQLMSQFMQFSESLGQPVGEEKQQPPMPGNVPPETAGRPSMPAM